MHEPFWPRYFLSDLSLHLNNLNPEAGDVNTLNDEFVKVFNDTLDTHAQYHYASGKEQCSFNKPWLTKGILISIAKKNILYKKQFNATNSSNIIKEYKTHRNKLTDIKELSKQNYYKHAFQKCSRDTKRTWKLVNEIISIKSKSQQNNKLYEDSECAKMSSYTNSLNFDDMTTCIKEQASGLVPCITRY